jgi:phosphoribosylanthranilate isomerase
MAMVMEISKGIAIGVICTTSNKRETSIENATDRLSPEGKMAKYIMIHMSHIKNEIRIRGICSVFALDI